MGAGIDPKVLRKRMYGRLKTIEKRLQGMGIQAKYRNLEVQGEHFMVYWAGCGPASNGESCHWLVLRFNSEAKPNASLKREGDVDYTNFHSRDIPSLTEGGFEAGIKAVQLRL